MSDKGLRFNEGKIRYDLLEPFAMEHLARIFTAGARKYPDNNWLGGMKWSKMIASLKRHLAAYERGEDYDFDPYCETCRAGKCTAHTGELHMAQVAWNAMGIVSYYKHYPQGDDRLHTILQRPKIGLDVDEVLCDWVGGWCSIWEIKDRPKSWCFQRDILEKFDQMKENGTLDPFYLSLKPLMKPEDIPFEPHCYITSRPVSTDITEQWLDKHGFPVRPVLTVPSGTSKVQACKDAGIDIMVDDRFENYEELNRNGICTFLYDSAHNQRYNVGYKRIKSLKELI